MKAALLIVLSLSALAFAGPAFNKNNQIETSKAQQQQQQQQQYMTAGQNNEQQTKTIETLKQWCFSSQMSQPELTSSFKKLVGIVKSSPSDQSTESAVMNERICQGALVQKSAQNGETVAQNEADASAHELIKDVYMDALIACESSECMQQLVKIINSNKVDTIRASYYMTRLAVSEKESIKDESEIKELAEQYIRGQQQSRSESVERQKLFAITSLVGKTLSEKSQDYNTNKQQKSTTELEQTAEQLAKTIVDRYIKSVSEQEVQQYQQQSQQQSPALSKKIAKRSAALKALANLPGWVLSEDVEQTLVQLAQNKQELNTVRQSAIECLEQNEEATKTLKQITFDQEEPIEVRVAAYRALMTVTFAGDNNKSEQAKHQEASEIVDQVVRHCEEQRNQQQDDQFVLYAISHLDNLRSSQQPEHKAIKDCIAKNKQHYMQIQLLNKKFKSQLNDVRKSSRNYKLEQEFNQIESGLVIEGDLVYESKHHQNQYNQQQQQQKQWTGPQVLPKLVRVNMSMPIMGETVNVVEITLRQNEMDEELLGALKLVQGAKFNSESMSKVVDSFKSSIEQQQQRQQGQQQQQSAEADLSIKVDGCTIVYLSVDDFKSSNHQQQQGQRRNTRSTSSGSIVDEIIEYLKRQPVAFNRGFNFNVNERLAKVLDVEANIIAGLRFESRASGQSSKDFEIVAQVEPRFGFEAIVGPAKMSSKKLLQRVSTKTALGLRLRYKSDELVDVQIDLPMNTMELFTIETQMVEKKSSQQQGEQQDSYSYLPESIYGSSDIYSPDEEYSRQWLNQQDDQEDQYQTGSFKGIRKMIKRSIFETKKSSGITKSIVKLMSGKQSTFAESFETSEEIARATGLRAKVRVVASPKDMSFLVQAVAQKCDQNMQGYRVQLQKSPRSDKSSQQYTIAFSTPGSRVDRNMQIRVIKQQTQQRTLIKSDIQSAKMSATAQCELVHDGRQYSIKTELASTTRGNQQQQQQQFRHQFEAGVQRGSQSQSGRVASTYKPYLSIESSSLKRPIQMQGVVSYQQSPKTVISYELKCPTSGDFVQGKVILDERANNANSNQYKRSTQRGRRSMQSPIELLLNKDLTLTSEFLGQVEQHAFKVHNMIDWDSDKFAVQSDLQASHKNLNNRNKQQESTISASLKLDQDQQMMTIQRKCPQQERKEFRVTVESDCRTPNQHQFVAECRYNGKRQSNLQSIVAYKHKVDLTSMSPKKIELGYTIEVQASECQISEKLTGRTQVGLERNLKTIETEISAHGKSAKLDVEYVSLEQHKLEVVLQGERLQHRTTVRQDERQCSVQSRTEKDGQMIGKVVVEINKQQGEGQLIVELPTENTHVAADLKLGSSKLSSVAIKSPRFASKAEFSFEKMMSRSAQKQGSQYLPAIWKKTFGQVEQFRFKTDLKDMMNKEAYWMESAWNKSPESKSYLRLDSPVYRTDIEFDPREQSTKFGLFARSKRSVNQLNKLYSNEESLLSSALESAKLQLGGNKMWMLRSVISSPSELKQQARRALFEYADRRQSQKHSVNWSPAEERVNFQFERQPSSEYQTASWSPMRFAGDLSRSQPSSLSMESEWIDFDVDAKPFGSEERYAKVSALSRHPRSAFKKHESEIRYQKKHGYSASMKHEDSQNKRHSMQLEADESPKKWTKMSFDSDKHGKAEYEHQWRKHVAKRNSHQNQHHQQQEQEEVYQNKVHFQRQSPKNNDWTHRSTLQWEEPTRFYQQQTGGRVRRDITGQDMSLEQQRRYNTIDYLKHVNARLQSQTSRNSADLYNVEFDYQPQHQQSLARLSVQMPEDMLHQSSFEFEPTERAYKLQSKLVNRRTNEPSYELLASSKLATSEQEPMFLNQEHPMLERPTGQSGRYYSTMTGLFKQPLKLDYTDKFGRIARVEYDQSPMSQAENKYQGLRQKRAALYYKDDSMDFEHQSSYDFYPETLFGALKPTKRVPGDLTIKAHTKFGPVVLHADSTDKTVEMQLESPIVNAKITGECSSRQAGIKRGTQLVRVQVDNKRQTVQLAKIVRQHPILREISIIEELAQQFDQSRFEHQTDLLINLVDSIYKIKSTTMDKQSPVMVIEGELNESQDKAYVKINGKRTNGQLVVDLVSGSAQLSLDVDNKRTIQHQTRLVRVSDKFYSLESMTSHKQQPLFKLNAKLEAKIFSEPEHVFAAHRSRQQQQKPEEHISTFEAVVYEPKPMQITGQFDCNKNEVRVNLKDMQSKKVSDVRVQYNQQTEKVSVEARQSNQRGTIVSSMQKTFNVAPLVEAY